MTFTDQLKALLEKATPGLWTATNEQTHLGPNRARTGAGWRLRVNGEMVADCAKQKSYDIELAALLLNHSAEIEATARAADEWKAAGDAIEMFKSRPNFDYVLTQDDRESMMARFRAAVTALYNALAMLNKEKS